MPHTLATSIHAFGLLLAADARAEGWSGGLRGAFGRGELMRVRPGVYLPSARWNDLSPEERHLARIHAVALTFEHPVFSHQSAAALLGLPLLRSRLSRLHLLQMTPRGSGSRGDVTVHSFSGDPDIIRVGGLRLTSPARTVHDLAKLLPHGEALGVADAAIRPASSGGSVNGAGAPLCTASELIERATIGIAQRGGWSAYMVASEADPRADSLGESMARSLFLRLGAPAPELQTRHHDHDGVIGYSDFFWREFHVIGEFDGRMKYGADNPSTLPPEQVVYREKVREDRLRRTVQHLVRFGWRDLQEPTRLVRILRDCGIPLDRSRTWSTMRRLVRDVHQQSLG